MVEIFVRRRDLPDSCAFCPFVNRDDECILQEDGGEVGSWDNLMAGCPLQAVEDAR